MRNTVTERLNELFRNLKPQLPDEDDEGPMTTAERILTSDPEIWAAVQAAAIRDEEQERIREEAQEVLAALEFAAEAMGGEITWQSLHDRLRVADLAPTERAVLDQLHSTVGEVDPGQTPDQRRQAHLDRMADRGVAFDQRVQGSLQGAVDDAAQPVERTRKYIPLSGA